MASSSTTQDEDLLIISEDSSDSTNDIDFSFNFTEDAPSQSVENSQTPATLQESSTQAVAETSASLGDFSFDVFSDATQAPEVAQTIEVIQVPENPIEMETSFSFDNPILEAPIVEDIGQEEILPVSIVQEVGNPIQETVLTETHLSGGASSESLNDILSSTIAKLALRAETIAQDSSSKTSHIANIKEQIKILEEQVASLEGDIGVLHAETEKISKNIDALEGMKLDPVKEHNARRVVKK